jgi:hypothetical protein
MSEKKPRADSKLDAMPESRVLELRDMLLASKAHKEIHSWLFSECGVTVDSSALTRFYKRHCAPVIRERRQFSVVKAEALGSAMAKDPVTWDDKIVERTKQLAFEFLSEDAPDPEAIKALLDALTKANKQALDREKFEEAKRKALLADKAKEVSDDTALSAEEKQARLKQIFGMG